MTISKKKTARIVVRLPPGMREWLDELSRHTDLPVSYHVRRILENAFERAKKHEQN